MRKQHQLPEALNLNDKPSAKPFPTNSFYRSVRGSSSAEKREFTFVTQITHIDSLLVSGKVYMMHPPDSDQDAPSRCPRLGGTFAHHFLFRSNSTPRNIWDAVFNSVTQFQDNIIEWLSHSRYNIFISWHPSKTFNRVIHQYPKS